MNFPSTLPPREDSARSALESSCAEALVEGLPGPALMVQRHVGAPVPAEALTLGVSATYVGSRSADMALILLDQSEVQAAGGDTRVQLGDVLRPALDLASAVIGGGMLDGVTDGAPASLFQSADATIFDLVGENGVAGWFAILVRGASARASRGGDVSSRLGRINNVEMTLAVEIGRAKLSVRELLSAQPGTVIELDRAVGANADVFLNGRMIAHGEIVVVDQRFAVRVTEVLDAIDEG